MPIFEYVCKGCGKKFEAILLGSQTAECPSCKGHDLDQQHSSFAARSKASASAPTAPCGMQGGGCGNCQFN